ncbi:MAG: cyclase [Gammaproteobacteria bacterium]|nr:cyclase [Gammaproteobacteria bacterium]
MISINRSAEVTYSAERMYELVNDIEAYPDFVHWCNATSIIAKNDTSLTASLSLSAGGVKKTFTTRNTMQPGRRIDINLLEGPFKHLTGYWLFEPLSEQACRISIKMNFEFKNKLLRLALDKIFSHIINTLIETFTERAQKVYGGNRGQ